MTRHPVEEGRVRSKIYSDKPYRAVNSSSEQGQDITQREDRMQEKLTLKTPKRYEWPCYENRQIPLR